MRINDIKMKILTVEPVFNPKTEDEQSELNLLLNWYSNNRNSKHAYKYIEDYLKKSQFDSTILINISKYHFPNTLGWLARIISRSKEPLNKLKTRFEQELTEIIKLPVESEKKVLHKKTIKDYNIQKSHEIIGELDGIIDEFLDTRIVPKICFVELFKKLGVNTFIASKIRDVFYKTQQELLLATSKKDKDLVEAYSYLKSDLKKFLNLVTSILDSVSELKNFRKPRIKKQKTPQQLVKNIKYAEVHETIRSLSPEVIVGAKQLICYNIKTKIVFLFICSNNHGLSLKKNKLVNYDLEKSRKLKYEIKTKNDIDLAIKEVKNKKRKNKTKLSDYINYKILLLKVE